MPIYGNVQIQDKMFSYSSFFSSKNKDVLFTIYRNRKIKNICIKMNREQRKRTLDVS